jgi:indolepyruvate ferredoxin oxidoreductase
MANGSTALQRRRDVTLADRYELEHGRVFLTGIQALVRVLLDQHRADARAGLRSATLVSGYQGSPLGGFDTEVSRLGALAVAHDIVHRPAVNEELAATAVWGSQLVATLPGPKYDGVLGVWYGKSPGVDRAADAIRHGNYVGTDPRGGVLALCGDDGACKSSTIPGASEELLASLRVPVIVPASVQEIVDLGRHAIACSRASGLWAALKVVTNVADATGTVEVGLERVEPQIPELDWDGAPFLHRPSARLLAPESIEMERSIAEVRLELAKLYARANGLNRSVWAGRDAKVGLVAAGTAASNLARALAELGVAADAPVRFLQLGMIYPLDEDAVRSFARGLDEVIVVEEKGPFVERLVRDALYGGSDRPRVLGKQDERGHPLLPAHGILDVDAITRVLGGRLLQHAELGERTHTGIRRRLERIGALDDRAGIAVGGSQRLPHFCSGCPHTSSVVAPDHALVGAGIGCHAMVMLSPRGYGNVTGVTQMGGEGAQWIGMAPFVQAPHFVQNQGDGTFHHSGSLAIRAAIAAKVNITYKLLFNGYVAMTGGQPIEGWLDPAAAAVSLAAEGVSRIVITTEDPAGYASTALPAIATVRPRSEMAAVQRELAKVEGVTVLLHDQSCAAELRRQRKRGRAPEPARRVVINERVCEGCGDCGEKSRCLSVEPIETEFGRKTRINQTSCNKDYSCLKGDCPSFITVTQANPRGVPRSQPKLPDMELPDPVFGRPRDVNVRLVGIGGTGVVTISQVLGMAAMLDGLHVAGLDQTGLSQKAGPVVSDVRIAHAPVQDGVGVPGGAIDVLLGLDIVGLASAANLRSAVPDRTVAVVSYSLVPTSATVTDVGAAAPDTAAARAAVDAVTRRQHNVYLDAQRISEVILGNATQANTVVLGAAWQAGVLPVSWDALREAFGLNGVAVQDNLRALELGRLCAHDPAAVAELVDPPPWQPALTSRERALVDGVTTAEGELRRLLEVRVPDLIGWGGPRAAEQYCAALQRVAAAEGNRVPGSSAVTQAVARGLHKLIAYKDEYEVARLHLLELDRLPAGAKIAFHLHPPLLRDRGLKRKMTFGRWFVPAFRALRAGRFLRGTPLDPFARTEVRRVERELPGEYLRLVETCLAALQPSTLAKLVEVAELPDMIRGYEEIKLAGVGRFRTRAGELTAELGVR